MKRDQLNAGAVWQANISRNPQAPLALTMHQGDTGIKQGRPAQTATVCVVPAAMVPATAFQSIVTALGNVLWAATVKQGPCLSFAPDHALPGDSV
jgi:hypothetical protein